MNARTLCLKSLIFAVLIFMVGCQAQSPQKETKPKSTPGILQAHFYDSGFKLGDDNYNSCFHASDGKIYYVIASGSVKEGAQMFAFDPKTEKIQDVADLTEAAGEKGLHAVPQGKGHSIFVESNGKLYFATHIGYYSPSKVKGLEVSTTPPGYKPYPGGHFMSYDLKTGQTVSLAKAPVNEGIISFAMDPARGRLYGLTWPSGLFLRYDMHTHQLKNFGPVTLGGENGIPGKTFRVICRSLALDPDDGSIYFTTADGDILQYHYDSDSITKVEECNLRKDVFGCLNPAQPGTMGYNWRQAFWYAPQKVFYAVHGRSGYLFKFDPRARKVTVLERFVSNPTRASGMYDHFAYGYLGFDLGPDGHTIYYLTGAPRKAKAPEKKGHPAAGNQDEDIHFVTYDINSGKTTDYGALQLADGQRPFFAESIAIGDKNIYTISKIRDAEGHVRVDLLSFPNPVR